MDNSGEHPLKVPGCGLPINSLRQDGFHHGIDDFSGARLTVREVNMLNFMNTITDKPDWDRKIYDESIVTKWQAEIVAQPRAGISDRAFAWCISELRDKATKYQETGFVKALDLESPCAKSDTLIGQTLRQQLIDRCKPLQDASHKDWHPRSNQQVLNLVHPSLFPLVYGKTRALHTGRVGLKNCLSSCGQGGILAAGQEIDTQKLDPWLRGRNASAFWSRRFQWLPCEIEFEGESGTNVEITSYINNLHPVHHESLYHIVESIISSSIPLWNEVLTIPGFLERPLRITTNAAEFDPSMPEWASGLPYSKPDQPDAVYEAQLDRVYRYVQQPDRDGFEPESDEDEPDLWEDEVVEASDTMKGSLKWIEAYGLGNAMDWKYNRIRQVAHPEPGDYQTWRNAKNQKAKPKKLEQQWRKEGLQVIVKLAGVELTPEKPKYEGGSWHLEGMLNEHIVATAIYYYDCENVSEARLAFRMNAWLDHLDLRYEQDDHGPLCELFGTESMVREPAIQELGSISTPEGRLLAFPNTLQHQVQPFELMDNQKPGHRRFLVLWLVDPHYRIMSTANVPPQQHDWWADETLRKVVAKSPLPAELSKMVEDEALEYPMGNIEAERLRLELMDERTSFGYAVQQSVEMYNLCEH